jgi:transposase InsO family protein
MTMTNNSPSPINRPLGDHLLIAGAKKKALLHHARAALVEAHSLLGLSLGYRLVDLRAKDDPLLASQAKIEELEARVAASEEIIALLGGRWDKIPDRERPHYTPEQRFRIVRIRRVLHLSVHDTAQIFRVSVDTIYEWDREARREPEKETIGSLVQPAPPARRYDDLTHHLVQTMGLLGFGGNLKIAECLANAAIRLSRRTVGRYRKQRRVPPPEGVPAPTTPRKPDRQLAVTARFVGHVWMMDLTTVPRLFGFRRFFVATVFDVFSRMPLAVETFSSQPSAARVTRLFDRAAQRFGRPKHFISDQGVQFTSELFQQVLSCLRVRQRFGAIGQKGSIAILERFWRTIKGAAGLTPLPPLNQQDLDRRLELALAHYAHHRPHRNLGGATPAEVFFGDRPRHLDAVQPPRGRPGARARPSSVKIASLDKEGRYPVLLKTA